MESTWLLLIFMMPSAYCYGLWREGYEPNTENGYSFIEEAVAPIVVRFERLALINKVRITATYTSAVETTVYWLLDVYEDSPITTTGDVEKDGQAISTSLEFSDEHHMDLMTLVITSNIGEIEIELKYNSTTTQNKTIEVPQTRVRLLVPYLIKPLPVEDACVNQFIYVKYERTNESVSLYSTGKDIRMDRIDSSDGEDVIEQKHYFTTFSERKRDYIGKGVLLKEEFIENGSVIVSSMSTYTFKGFPDIEGVKTSRYGVIVPPSGEGSLAWFDDIVDEEFVVFNSTFPYRSIVCKAFGFPRPEVTITDTSGRALPVSNLTLKPGLLTHVIANLDNMTQREVDREYTCTATSGQKSISRKITVNDGGVEILKI